MLNQANALLAGILWLGTAGLSHAQAIPPPAGAPPGYYPGSADGVQAYERAEWQQWAAARRPAIETLATRIKAAQASGTSPGCIGKTAADCVVTLAQDLAIADSFRGPSLLDPSQIDVNGRRIALKFVVLTAFLPGRAGEPQGLARQIPYLTDKHLVFLFLSPKNTITEIHLGDGRNTIFQSRTEADYDRTAIYEIIAPLTRAHCPNLARPELYRFIENRLKTPAQKATAIGATRSYIGMRSSGFVAFCGRKLGIEITFDTRKWRHRGAQITEALVIK